MFKPLFEVMNETLDEIMEEYPTAQGSHKQLLTEQLEVLKAMSDYCVEEWLSFEEKLGIFRQMKEISDSKSNPLLDNEHYIRGKGYFDLMMFSEAILEFEAVAHKNPDLMPPHFYLALSHLQEHNYTKAYRHFNYLLPLTEDSKVKAVSYNAMGCIHAVEKDMDKACELFQLAHETDPSLKDPLKNMTACMNHEGTLHYGTGDMNSF
jgi:tetratricopeptide (TPR) repeat protein